MWGGMLKAATQQLASESNATAEGETSGHSRRGRDPEVVQIEPFNTELVMIVSSLSEHNKSYSCMLSSNLGKKKVKSMIINRQIHDNPYILQIVYSMVVNVAFQNQSNAK